MKRPQLTVEDLMTTAVTALKAGDTVAHVRDEMSLAEIRHVPVVDEHNRVIGIVSSHDMARAARARSSTRIAEVMTRPVRTVRPYTPAAEAAAQLIEARIGALPVVAEDGHLVGVITATDFLAVARQALAGLPIEDART